MGGPGSGSKPTRFCPKGHDKGREGGSCPMCQREGHARWVAKQPGGGMAQIKCNVSKDDEQRFRQIAADYGMSKNALLRELVDALFAEIDSEEEKDA